MTYDPDNPRARSEQLELLLLAVTDERNARENYRASRGSGALEWLERKAAAVDTLLAELNQQPNY